MKVKFTKLAALLLAGVALFATGCTDYEVDIQKVDKKVDNLTTEVNGKIASLEQQIAGINATIATLETKAAHDADIQTLRNELAAAKSALQDEFNGKINKAIADLTAEINKKVNQADYDVDKAKIEKAIKDVNDALNAAKDRIKALEDADYQGQIDAAKDRIKALEDAHFQDQIDAATSRITKLENLLAGDWDGKTVKETIDALAETVADLETEVNGKIDALELRVKANEDAIKEIKETTIPALQAQVDDINNVKIPALQADIEALKSGKLDKSEFEAYKAATAATIELMQKAIKNLEDTKVDKTEFEAKVAEIIAKFDDYVLKTTFEDFVKIAATKAELAAVKAELEGRIKVCEDLLKGDWGGKTVQEYIDAKDAALQEQIDKIVKELIPALDERVKALEKTVNEVIIPQIQFAIDYQGVPVYEALGGGQPGLQGYINDMAIDTLLKASQYTDAEVKKVRDELNAFKAEMYGLLKQLASRIQSIVYVPDYDDLKITSNMAKTTLPGVEGALYVDQPTEITYKILPAEYAAAVADNFKDLLVFDVKTVKTRADGDAAAEPSFQILKVEKDAKIDENGLVTFTVLPENVASAAFAATDIPVEFNAVFGWETLTLSIFGLVDIDVPVLGYDDELVYPVVTKEDLDAYLARTAFAASLRFACQDIDIPTDPASEEYNEVASTYNVLFPAVTSEVEVPAEAFKKLDDGSIRQFTEDERHLQLPYNSPDTKIILDQAVAGYVVKVGDETNLMSYEQAAEAGIVVPKYDIQFPGDVYYVDVNGNQDEKNYLVNTESYVKVNMNLDEPSTDRMFEIDNQVAASYTFKSGEYSFTDEGDVTITKELGEVSVSADAVWTWNWNKDEDDPQAPDYGDALIDHNRFYEDAPDTNYVRLVWPVAIDKASADKLEDDLGLTLENFDHVGPKVSDDQKEWLKSLKVEVADRLDNEGNEIADDALVFAALADDDTFAIENVTIKDDELFADFKNFKWDKVYKITAVYELEFAVITVNGIFKTYDRNREPVAIAKYEYTFGINEFDEKSGNGYIAGENGNPGYYYWKSDPMHKAIFEVFDAEGVINVRDNVDFEFDADQDAFNEGELDTHIRAYYDEPGPGTAFKYVDISRNGIYAQTKSADSQISAKDLLELSTGEQDPDDPYVFLGKVITRYITTYIGEVVEIPFQFNYRVPAYDFLHQTNYTFDDGKWYAMASPKYDENKKSLKKYDVEYMNVPALAFNIVDKNKRFFNYKDQNIPADDPDYFYNDSLKINFFYTGPAPKEPVDTTTLEAQSATDAIKKYGDLWFNATDEAQEYSVVEADNYEHTVFYYRSTRDYIPMYGTLEIACDGVRFPIPTSFEANNGGKYIASEIREVATDYSNFELRAWKPFYVPTYTQDLVVKLDEHGKYVVNILEGLQFFDGRQVAASTPVDEVKDPFVEGTYKIDAFNGGTNSYFRPMLGFNADPQTAEEKWGWIVGDADSTNGYYPGVSSWDAYDLQKKSFIFTLDGVPKDLRRLIDVDEETYTMTFDYNSQIQFSDTATISFGFDLQSPWQKFEKPFTVNVVIKGLNVQ